MTSYSWPHVDFLTQGFPEETSAHQSNIPLEKASSPHNGGQNMESPTWFNPVNYFLIKEITTTMGTSDYKALWNSVRSLGQTALSVMWPLTHPEHSCWTCWGFRRE